MCIKNLIFELLYSCYRCADGTESRSPWDGRTVMTPIPGFLHGLFSMKVKYIPDILKC